MVFSPQTAPPDGENEKKTTVSIIQTKPTETKEKPSVPDIQPSKTHKTNSEEETKKQAKGTKVVVSSVIEQNVINPSDDNNQGLRSPKSQEAKIQPSLMTKSPMVSSQVQVKSKDETAVVKNNLAEPEYDFLSKQPAEVVDETYKLINLRPSSKAHTKPRPTPRREKENPTGLVTKLGGTIVKDGLTTVHETSVIGTYINGKYAQVLQSSSRILAGTPPIPEGKIRPSGTQRILKTIGPHQGKLRPQLEPTPINHQEESSLPLEVLFSAPAGSTVRSTRKNVAPNLSRPKFRNKINDDYDGSGEVQQQTKPGKNRTPTTARPGYKNRSPPTTTTEPPVTRRRSSFRPNNQPSLPSKQTNKNKNEQQPVSPNPVPKLKLPRTQGRWSYKTTPKPRIAIRKQIDVDDEQRSTSETFSITESPTNVDDSKTTPSTVSTSTTTTTIGTAAQPANVQRKIQEAANDDELDPSESEDVASVSVQDQHAEQILPVETINAEISTAADMSNVYFEIATIKSPYTFQVGTLRNTRYVTITSTMKKLFSTIDPTSTLASPSEPLTENLLANTAAAYETTLPLDSAVATLPAISLESGQATPPLETITETFSTTQTLLKTYLLPVIHGGNTTKLTLVQTYNIARVVTATKTLPPMDIYHFIPSKALNEFNSKLDEAGSELHLELEDGDQGRDDDDIPKRVVAPSADMDSDLEPFKSISPSKLKSDAPASSIEPQLTPDQLALLKYFGQQQPQVITTSRPVVVLDTVYESHVIPVVNNGNTVYSTLSRPVGTVPRTSYEFGTSTIAPVLPPQLPPPQLPPQLPLFPQQPQFTVTSAPLVTQTLATLSESKILKLTFGAKTAYTTLFSSRVVPTEITTYVTTTVPIQPTVSPFPAYYPPPVGYPPFPFVG
ncbi:uncharacterized protein LOC143430427 [Xylocopa sonorina]|uniref:uncharacterized protein LOC143430427 n=1 Tax=Xylocopa sonorina TaxID=1818115 RepID=UPI00403B37DC